MTLYYCGYCNAVSAFDPKDIAKHGLEPIADRKCPVCYRAGLLLRVEEEK